ncbi:MAG: efflux RND transporter periplasmic adaptor subunit [Bacteroidia bacterium]
MLPVVLMLLAGVACKRSEIPVETDQASVRTVYARVSESGVIQPTIEVPISPDVSGEIVFLPVIEGQKVKRGDLLLTIRPDDYRAQLEQAAASVSRSQAAYLQAQAGVEQARATLLQDSVSRERTRQLFREKVVSQLDLENADLRFEVSRSQFEAARFNVQAAFYQVESAEATRKQARQNLDRTNIYASMDGTITLLNVELGQRVVGTSMMSGTEMLKVADLSSMEVIVEVNENDIINVSMGDSARIEVDAYPGKTFYGRVTEIAYSATVTGMASTDQVTNFEVKVKFDPASYATAFGDERRITPGESPFRPGMTALVEVYTQAENDVTVVPIQAVTLRGQSQGNPDEVATGGQEVVFRYKDGKVEQVPVETGISDDTHIHIRSGLSPGDVVVTGPYTTLTRMLRDGMAVTAKEAAKP